MTTTTVPDVFGMADKQNIIRIRGRLTKVWETKKGSSANGPWTVQRIVLEGGGKEIEASIWNHDDVPDEWKGKEIYLMSYNGKKGWGGVYAEDRTWTDKNGQQITKRGIKVSDTGEVELASEIDQREGSKADDDIPFDAPEPIKPAAPAQVQKHHPMGATVGMAINNAVNVAREVGIQPGTKAFSKFIYEVASDILRVSEMLEAGRLAPAVKERVPIAESGDPSGISGVDITP
jgi:hypothetical protein